VWNGERRRSTPVECDLIVQTRTFQVRAGRSAPWAYCFMAAETVVAASRVTWEAGHIEDCIDVSGQYGQKHVALSIADDGRLPAVWTALVAAGARLSTSQPPI
jgi:hypothetical protein